MAGGGKRPYSSSTVRRGGLPLAHGVATKTTTWNGAMDGCTVRSSSGREAYEHGATARLVLDATARGRRRAGGEGAPDSRSTSWRWCCGADAAAAWLELGSWVNRPRPKVSLRVRADTYRYAHTPIRTRAEPMGMLVYGGMGMARTGAASKPGWPAPASE